MNERMPAWLKVGLGAFVVAFVPLYWWQHGPANFLWFSDLALFLVAWAIIAESRFVGSVVATLGLALETLWLVDFLVELAGFELTGLTAYMMDDATPLWLRALSLFHVPLPPLMLFLVLRLGYDRRAWPAAAALGAVVIVASRLLTDPSDNVNWVFGDERVAFLGPVSYLALQIVVTCGVVFGLTHAGLIKLDAWAARRELSRPPTPSPGFPPAGRRPAGRRRTPRPQPV